MRVQFIQNFIDKLRGKKNALELIKQFKELKISVLDNTNAFANALEKNIASKADDILKAIENLKENKYIIIPETFLTNYLNKINNNESDCILIDNILFKKNQNAFGLAEIFARRDYEIAGIEDYVLIDVGANVADSTLYFANNACCRKVYAYEPFSMVYGVANENIDLNPHLKNKIKLAKYGWGNSNKILNVAVSNDINLSGGNTICDFFNEKLPILKNSYDQIEIKSSSEELKRILQENPSSKIILKMDIEGSEYECLENLVQNDMLKYINIIVLEWHFNGYIQILNMLKKHNFICFNERFQNEVGFIRAVNMNTKKYQGDEQ